MVASLTGRWHDVLAGAVAGAPTTATFTRPPTPPGDPMAIHNATPDTPAATDEQLAHATAIQRYVHARCARLATELQALIHGRLRELEAELRATEFRGPDLDDLWFEDGDAWRVADDPGGIPSLLTDAMLPLVEAADEAMDILDREGRALERATDRVPAAYLSDRIRILAREAGVQLPVDGEGHA